MCVFVAIAAKLPEVSVRRVTFDERIVVVSVLRCRGGEPMSDDESNRGPSRDDGPPETQFLDLEISSVLYGEADRLCREAARDLMREAIRQRLDERLGDHLREVGRIAADVLADDIETNLEIESLIVDRRAGRASIGERVREIMRSEASNASKRKSKKRKR
jgi:hypothetical protein